MTTDAIALAASTGHAVARRLRAERPAVSTAPDRDLYRALEQDLTSALEAAELDVTDAEIWDAGFVAFVLALADRAGSAAAIAHMER